MATIVVDTDVVSFAFKGDTRADWYAPHLTGPLLAISFMTLAELDCWALERRWGETRKQRMRVFLGRFMVHPYDRALCLKWAEVMHQTRRRGRPIQVADAWHAATALALDVPLVTHNPADFAGVEGLEVISEAGGE